MLSDQLPNRRYLCHAISRSVIDHHTPQIRSFNAASKCFTNIRRDLIPELKTFKSDLQ